MYYAVSTVPLMILICNYCVYAQQTNKLFSKRAYLYVCACVFYVVTFREVIGRQSRVGARFEAVASRRERCVSLFLETITPQHNYNTIYIV